MKRTREIETNQTMFQLFLNLSLNFHWTFLEITKNNVFTLAGCILSGGGNTFCKSVRMRRPRHFFILSAARKFILFVDSSLNVESSLWLNMKYILFSNSYLEYVGNQIECPIFTSFESCWYSHHLIFTSFESSIFVFNIGPSFVLIAKMK